MKNVIAEVILAKLRSPRLHKFSDSHAPYGRVARYRDAVEKASLEKLAKMLKALSFLAQTKVYLLWKKPTNHDSTRTKKGYIGIT